MSRLIVVSNRVTPPDPPGEAQSGGLAVALAGALRAYSGFWFGWSGETVETFTGELHTRTIDDLTTVTLDLDEADYQEYYNGYANGALWPLFHYRIDLTAYDRSFSTGYERVNRRFAESLAPLVEPGDLIWIHDYHLISLGRELRRLGVTNPIGFFLHIPWPAPQLLTTLPRHQELVEALFSCDLVGFQSEDWLWAFEAYVLGEAAGRWAPDGRLQAFGATLRAQVFPIGLDTDAFLSLANSPAAHRAYDRMAANTAFRSLIVGVDRLDYSKGLEERLLGFERLLVDNPGLRREVLYLQVAPTSRGEVEAYQDLRAPYRRLGRTDQRILRRHGLGADPLRSSELQSRRTRRHLSGGPGLPGDSPARRDESGRQGIYRGSGPLRSRRPGAVAVHWRRAPDDRGGDRQSVQPRGDGRGDQESAQHGSRGARAALDKPDGGGSSR